MILTRRGVGGIGGGKGTGSVSRPNIHGKIFPNI